MNNLFRALSLSLSILCIVSSEEVTVFEKGSVDGEGKYFKTDEGELSKSNWLGRPVEQVIRHFMADKARPSIRSVKLVVNDDTNLVEKVIIGSMRYIPYKTVYERPHSEDYSKLFVWGSKILNIEKDKVTDALQSGDDAIWDSVDDCESVQLVTQGLINGSFEDSFTVIAKVKSSFILSAAEQERCLVVLSNLNKFIDNLSGSCLPENDREMAVVVSQLRHSYIPKDFASLYINKPIAEHGVNYKKNSKRAFRLNLKVWENVSKEMVIHEALRDVMGVDDRMYNITFVKDEKVGYVFYLTKKEIYKESVSVRDKVIFCQGQYGITLTQADYTVGIKAIVGLLSDNIKSDLEQSCGNYASTWTRSEIHYRSQALRNLIGMSNDWIQSGLTREHHSAIVATLPIGVSKNDVYLGEGSEMRKINIEKMLKKMAE